MKIAYCSDLHLEFELGNRHHGKSLVRFSGVPNSQGADVLVLAGDIAEIHQTLSGTFDEFWDKVSEQYDHVVYVLGNHEYYHYHYVGAAKELQKYIEVRYSNIHVLHDRSVVLGDVLFVGATLFTDQNENDPTSILAAERGMADYHHIKFHQTFDLDRLTNKLEVEDTIAFHYVSKLFLETTLEENKDKTKVVVTHHLPLLESIDEKFKGSLLNGSFASDLSELILDNNIHTWIHGHTHEKKEYKFGNTYIRCNPRGYLGYECSYSDGKNLTRLFEIKG